ncbi:hypothetical protein [Neobacillus sp. CF12]|uniref:hypothetical protein n=1 Tax=Neobacillus sp. CF12 TaxID=3055864 RepID=UPI0025A0EBC6|nr:hypothetical protein [Neobacillus sp. CF12]MDM5329232.1 hypothetical protein [Neobacillus sp. CF12]
MTSNKMLLISSIILSLGIIVGASLIGSNSASVSEPLSKKEVQASILLDSKEASELLGISEKELLKIITEEKRILETTGSYDGALVPYIMIDGKRYFERTKLLVWAQESSSLHKEY